MWGIVMPELKAIVCSRAVAVCDEDGGDGEIGDAGGVRVDEGSCVSG